MANNNQSPSLQTSLRDYRHAEKVFRSDAYALSPKFEHLFHVVFTFEPEASRLLGSGDQQEYSLLVKSVDLPNFTIDVEEYNQYNRRVQAHHRITYNPITVVFHDDASNKILNLWATYYQFYFKDPTYDRNKFAQTDRYNDRSAKLWGHAEGRPRFFNEIKIYSLHQKRFVEYTLINPIVNDFRHGRHSYDGTGVMEHQMSFSYEGVKYSTGYINGTGNSPLGFGEIYYDDDPSPIANAQSINTTFQNGRVVDVTDRSSTSLGSVFDPSSRTGQTQNDNTSATTSSIPAFLRNSSSNTSFPVPTPQQGVSTVSQLLNRSRAGDNIQGSVQNVVNSVISNGSFLSNNKFSSADVTRVATDIGQSVVRPIGNAVKNSGARISDVVPVSPTGVTQIDRKIGELGNRILTGSAQGFDVSNQIKQFANLAGQEAARRLSTQIENATGVSINPRTISDNLPIEQATDLITDAATVAIDDFLDNF